MRQTKLPRRQLTLRALPRRRRAAHHDVAAKLEVLAQLVVHRRGCAAALRDLLHRDAVRLERVEHGGLRPAVALEAAADDGFRVVLADGPARADLLRDVGCVHVVDRAGGGVEAAGERAVEDILVVGLEHDNHVRQRAGLREKIDLPRVAREAVHEPARELRVGGVEARLEELHDDLVRDEGAVAHELRDGGEELVGERADVGGGQSFAGGEGARRGGAGVEEGDGGRGGGGVARGDAGEDVGLVLRAGDALEEVFRCRRPPVGARAETRHKLVLHPILPKVVALPLVEQLVSCRRRRSRRGRRRPRIPPQRLEPFIHGHRAEVPGAVLAPAEVRGRGVDGAAGGWRGGGAGGEGGEEARAVRGRDSGGGAGGEGGAGEELRLGVGGGAGEARGGF
mmetsp:Transcript_26182/g.65467  ORF Transcript_26182/g.65467 Transcript_26182/m.65467 type:complete len:396 (-) Transcript_26182:2-1189(-)